LKTTTSHIDTEALIIGAGPIGLFQAFELGLLGVECCIVESLDRPGGQCTELYADKPIYDIPGTAYTTAAEFISQLEKQIQPFNTTDIWPPPRLAIHLPHSMFFWPLVLAPSHQ